MHKPWVKRIARGLRFWMKKRKPGRVLRRLRDGQEGGAGDGKRE